MKSKRPAQTVTRSDEKMWTDRLQSPDPRTRLDALMYLTDIRDGIPAIYRDEEHYDEE